MILPLQEDTYTGSSIPPASLGRNGGFRLVSFAPLASKPAREKQGEKPDPNNIYFIDKIVGSVVSGEYSLTRDISNR
jgi:hypothetical protein